VTIIIENHYAQTINDYNWTVGISHDMMKSSHFN